MKKKNLVKYLIFRQSQSVIPNKMERRIMTVNKQSTIIQLYNEEELYWWGYFYRYYFLESIFKGFLAYSGMVNEHSLEKCEIKFVS